MTKENGNLVYRFNGFHLDPRRRRLAGPDRTLIALKPRVFDTLQFFVENAGKLLDKNALMTAIWGESVVEENSLNQHISLLRRSLGETPGENRFIVTVPGRGYQFVANVETRSDAPQQRHGLAVLPFENLSGDPDQSYFVDGMTEELTTQLARISGLRVVSRTSAMTYSGSEKLLPTIAAELGVSLVIEGSTLRAGDRIRITAQLIDATKDTHLWAESYERAFADVLILQSEIAQAIARCIEVQITGDEQARLASAHSVIPESYDACLKGLEYYYKLSPADLEQALKYFQHALRLDVSSARAHAGIAAVWIGRQQMGFVANRVATPLAKEAALRAVELDGSLAEARFVLSEVKGFGEFDLAAAEPHMLKAIELKPSYAEARAVYAHELCCLQRHEEALAQIEQALELDPFNPFFKAFYGVVLYLALRYDDAIEQFKSALQVMPGLPFALQTLSNCFHMSGRFDEALQAQKMMFVALGDRDAGNAIDEGHESGGYKEAMRRLADVTGAQSLEVENGACYVAMRYAHAGDVDRMLEWLERAVDQRDPNVPYIRAPLPETLCVVDDARFRALLRRLEKAKSGMYYDI